MSLADAFRKILRRGKNWPPSEDAWLEHSREYWARGYKKDSRGEVVNAPESYWLEGDVEASYTVDLLDALTEVGGTESAIELGCNAGRNLHHVWRAYPEAKLTGIDINEEALAYAREHAEGANEWELRHGDLTDPHLLDHLPDGSVDVIYSVAVLVHLPPGEHKAKLLEICRRKARKAIILIEPHTEGEMVWNRVDDQTMSPFCIEDYRPYLPGNLTVRQTRKGDDSYYDVLIWRPDA